VRLFLDPVVTVAESEADDYASLPCEVVTHPDDVKGIGPLRQWVLDHFDDEVVVMADDDLLKVYTLIGQRKRTITKPDSIAQILENAVEIARGMGAPVFGFNQAWDVRKFQPQDPLHFHGWTGGVIGIIGRELQFDKNLLLRADVDFCLQALLEFRTVFIDQRFSFVHRRFVGSGGNAHLRSAERNERELGYLQDKWGKWLSVRQTKTTTRLVVNVLRRQRLV
jgi:hypothetical protein